MWVLPDEKRIPSARDTASLSPRERLSSNDDGDKDDTVVSYHSDSGEDIVNGEDGDGRRQGECRQLNLDSLRSPSPMEMEGEDESKISRQGEQRAAPQEAIGSLTPGRAVGMVDGLLVTTQRSLAPGSRNTLRPNRRFESDTTLASSDPPPSVGPAVWRQTAGI